MYELYDLQHAVHQAIAPRTNTAADVCQENLHCVRRFFTALVLLSPLAAATPPAGVLLPQLGVKRATGQAIVVPLREHLPLLRERFGEHVARLVRSRRWPLLALRCC